MKVKYLVIVSLILAILTICAVSASEDVSIDDELAVSDEGVDIEEAPVDEEIVASDEGEDEAIAVADDENVVGEDEDDWDYGIFVEDDTLWWGDYESDIAVVVSHYDEDLSGKVVLKADGNTFFSKNIVLKANSQYWITAEDVPELPIGEFHLEAIFTPNGEDPDSDEQDVEVIPNIDKFTIVAPNQDVYAFIVAPAGYSGTAKIYNYDSNTGEKGSLVTQVSFNGKTRITLPKLQSDHSYVVDIQSQKFNGGIIIDFEVYNNDANVRSSVTPIESTVGTPITITASSNSIGDFSFWVDMTCVKEQQSVRSMSHVLSNLAVGQYVIDVLHADENGINYHQVYLVTVKAKPAPAPAPAKEVVSLALKKVKSIKKSAKKLVLQATLKVNGKAKSGVKVTFKLNKKTFTAKTNKKGVAKVTIKKKVLKKLKGKKATIQASYGSTVKKMTVKVKG